MNYRLTVHYSDKTSDTSTVEGFEALGKQIDIAMSLPEFVGYNVGPAKTWKIRIAYKSGYSDLGECDTEAQAREVVSAATLRMMSGEYGIDDVACWAE